ncbi:MAG: zinc-ribbon domain-containing protein [Candidatus Hodarchaeota archaeon]
MHGLGHDVLCFYCGHANPGDAQFCAKCGRYLGSAYG